MMNCDKGEFQVWMLKDALSTIANKPRTPIATNVYLNIKALNLRDCYSGTVEFSAANGVHVTMDSSSGSIKLAQYTLTASDGTSAPIFAGSTTKLFLY